MRRPWHQAWSPAGGHSRTGFSGSIARMLRIETDNPELSRAQLEVLSSQIPLLYFILVVNAAALAITHAGTAPAILAIYLPIMLTAACAVRVVVWRRTRGVSLGDEAVVARLRLTFRLVCVLGAAFTAWALSLYPYGDAYARVHVAFYMSITVIGCIFCLMNFRPAALMLTGIVVLPFTAFFATTGNIVLVAIALNLVLVAGAMIRILLSYSAVFAKLIDSRKILELQNAEARRLSEQNQILANCDSLTGLANRRRFLADLDEAVGEGRSTLVLGLIDLDGFKPVNDLYGHAVGDQVLIETSRRLRLEESAEVRFARLGGDEFAILIRASWGEAEILEVGERICRSIHAPFDLPDAVAQLSASIGFAVFPDAAATVEHLLERADYALYHAKQNERGHPVVFSQAHQDAILAHTTVEQTLRSTDLEAEFHLVFQPICEAGSGRTLGYEALARWHSPVLGIVPPSEFIKAAERSDLISRLTQVLLGKAIAAAREWPNDLGLSFNLSARDLASPAAILRIVAQIEASGLRPERLSLEVTETAVMRDFDQARQNLGLLKRLGVHISLDDFGTGYSSLSYVHRLPLDKIKVDRSFIADIESDAASRSIVKTVVDLCRNLHLDCVVEGVETEAQSRILQRLGCTTMQGYLFGRPMEKERLAALDDGRRRA